MSSRMMAMQTPATVKGNSTMVAPLFGHRDVHRLLPGPLPPFRFPHGGLFGGHHGDGAVLPEQYLVGHGGLEGAGLDGGLEHGQQRPGDTGEKGTDGKGQFLVPEQVHPHGLGGDLVVPDGLEHPAVGGILRDIAHRGHRRHRLHQRQRHRLLPLCGLQRVVAALFGC